LIAENDCTVLDDVLIAGDQASLGVHPASLARPVPQLLLLCIGQIWSLLDASLVWFIGSSKTTQLPENPSNKPWETFLTQIQSANIPEYEQKSKTERARWENLFRNNVLQRIDQALTRATRS